MLENIHHRWNSRQNQHFDPTYYRWYVSFNTLYQTLDLGVAEEEDGGERLVWCKEDTDTGGGLGYDGNVELGVPGFFVY